MTNYNELSDFEINKRVAYLVDGTKKVVCTASTSGYGSVNVKNYCNNPADAWPIIVDNRISIGVWSSKPESTTWWSENYNGKIRSEWTEENPLRAAMIVFLMMREENGRL
jgi:hypothetical protein